MTTEVKELLCVVVDLDANSWATAESKYNVRLEDVLEQLVIFCNAHLAMRHENEIAVIGSSSGESTLLYSSLLEYSESVSDTSSTYQPFRLARDGIVNGVKRLAEKSEAGKPITLARALAMAMCHMNKHYGANDAEQKARTQVLTRFLVLSVSEDDSAQYVPVMNCIFAAQKFKVVIDVCKILGDRKGFLEQASYLTGGIYEAVDDLGSLLQYLMVTFLPGIIARRQLQLPSQERVDLRSTCFCHHKVVDQGYICSVCLSIYCRPIPFCTTCGTKFPMATLKRYLNVLKVPKAQ